MKNPKAILKHLVSILILLLPTMVSAGIYSWTDENGKLHYGDRPPFDRKADIVTVRVNSYASPSEIPGVDSRHATREKVVMYTTQSCGYCKKAKQFLKRKNISYTEYDVETSQKGKRDYRKLNGTGVPIIMIGDQRMDGFSEGRLASMLKNSGYK